MEVAEALKILMDRLKKEEIPVVLFGGMALYKFGVERLSMERIYF